MELTENDAKQIERFRNFLRITNDAPKDEQGRSLISEQTMRYVRGEDVDPQ